MGHKDFRRQVETQAKDVPRHLLDWSIDHHIREGKTEKWDVRDCIVLAGDAAAIGAKAPQAPLEEFDAAATYASSRIAETIAPEVERVRSKLFDGLVTAPFPSHEDAVTWLEGLKNERTAEQKERARKIFSEWADDPRRAKVEDLTGNEVLVTLQAHMIPYVALDGSHVTHAVVDHASRFVELEHVARRLAGSTGFDEARMVLHILCGAPLVLPSIRITKSVRFGSGSDTVRVDFNSPDVTHAQIARVLTRVRGAWGKAGRNRMKPEDARFLQIVEELEGVPESGKKAFFTAVRDVCEDEGIGSYKKSGWRGPYRRWQRLTEKLGTKEN